MVAPDWSNFQMPDSNQPQSNVENNFEATQDIQDNLKPESEKPIWGSFDSPMTYQGESSDDESPFSWTIRNMAANASRVGEQAIGKYGNMEKMGKDILVNNPLAGGGVVGWALSELMGPERWERLVRGQPGDQQRLPTSEDLKNFSQNVTGGYTKPKTPGEERFQGYTEDIASTISGRTARDISRINPATRNNVARNIAVNNILIPSAANFTKNVVEDLGFSKDQANLAKLAVWLPSSLAANVNGREMAANLMNQGRRAFGPNLVANIPRYQANINQRSQQFLQGDPRSDLARQQIAAIENDIANGQTSMQDLMTRYDAINAAKRDRGLFALNRADRRAAIRNIDQVRNGVREEIEALGASNPQGLRNWQNGVMAFQTIHTSNALTNWIQGVAKGPYGKVLAGPAGVLFGIGSYGGAAHPLVAGTGSLAIPAAYQTGKTLYRMWDNRTLADYYWRAISAAQAENIPAFINNYNKLNKGLKKSDATE